MSRIGKKAVATPSGVQVALDGQTVSVKGPKGQLAWTVPEEIEVKHADGQITLAPREDNQRARAMWGLSRTLVNNMVEGVTKGYEQSLELVGVGYRAAMKGQALSLQLGFSHDVDIPAPEGAARIRKIRPPEPYKGKGVRYAGEKVRRKEGKKK
jgi:large subunit ribosomal protein L6